MPGGRWVVGKVRTEFNWFIFMRVVNGGVRALFSSWNYIVLGMAPIRWILEATRWMLMDGGRTSDGEFVYVKDSSRRRSAPHGFRSGLKGLIE